MENFPLKSVCAPDCVPYTNTLTPGRGRPALSETTPETVLSCANVICATNANKSIKNPFNFNFILVCFDLILQTS